MADMHINKKNKRFDEYEIDIIKEHYPNGGYKLVQQFLPHRSSKSISEKARLLNICSNNKSVYFSNEEIDILKKYYPIGGYKLVQEYLPNRSENVIYQKANQLGISGSTNYFSEYENDIIRKYYPQNGYDEVLKHLKNRTKSSIQQQANKLGVKYLTYNKDYFEKIDTSEKAYWLGFLYADGYVTTDSRWGLMLQLSDEMHLKKLIKAIGSNVKIRRGEKKSQSSDNVTSYCSFSIKNKKMHDDLIDKGVIPNKTPILKFPTKENLPIEFMSHFIRGFFDGDGCIFVKKNKEYDSISAKEISVCCKSNEFIMAMRDIIFEQCGVQFKYRVEKSHNDLNYLRIYKYSEIENFVNYIYKDKECGYLERKFEKSQEILKNRLV